MERFLLSLLLVSICGTAGLLAVMLLARVRRLAIPAGWLRAAYIVLIAGLLIPVRPALWDSAPAAVVYIAPVTVQKSVPAAEYETVPEAAQMEEITLQSLQSPSPETEAQAAAGMEARTAIQRMERETPAALHGSEQKTDWIGIIFCLWAVVAALKLACPAWKHMRFLRMVRRWGVREMRSEHATGVRTYRCAFVHSPFCAGVLRPMLLLPEKEEIDEDILRHETAHLKQRDLWLRAALMLARAMHWFNPAMRLLEAELTAACEICADEICMQGADMDGRRRYAETVLRSTFVQAAVTPLTMQFSGGKKRMKRRIRAILTENMGRCGILALAAALICTMLAPAVLAEEGLLDGYISEGALVPPMSLPWDAKTDEIIAVIRTTADSVVLGYDAGGRISMLCNDREKSFWPGTDLQYRIEWAVKPEEQTLCCYSLVGEYGLLEQKAPEEIAELEALILGLNAQLSAFGAPHVLSGPDDLENRLNLDRIGPSGLRIRYVGDGMDAQLLISLSDVHGAGREITIALSVGDLSHAALSDEEWAAINLTENTAPSIDLAPPMGVEWGSSMVELIPKIERGLNETGEIITNTLPVNKFILTTHAFREYPGFHYSYEPYWIYTNEDELQEIQLIGKSYYLDSMTDAVRTDIDALLRQMSGHFAGYEILVYGTDAKPAPELIREGFGMDLVDEFGSVNVFYTAADGGWAQIHISVDDQKPGARQSMKVIFSYSATDDEYAEVFDAIRAEYASAQNEI